MIPTADKFPEATLHDIMGLVMLFGVTTRFNILSESKMGFRKPDHYLTPRRLHDDVAKLIEYSVVEEEDKVTKEIIKKEKRSLMRKYIAHCRSYDHIRCVEHIYLVYVKNEGYFVMKHYEVNVEEYYLIYSKNTDNDAVKYIQQCAATALIVND